MALDLSLSNTGIAIFDEEENVIELGSAPTNRKDSYAVRLKTIADRVQYFASKYLLSTVVIERGFTKFHASTQALFRVQGAVMLVLYKYPQIFYSPTTIKKCLSGKGNASKDLILEKVLKIYPTVEVSNTDESDAIAVGVTYFKKMKEEEEDCDE
jgi:Holliday junction resolvasome RuvABC endonuclease subunit